MKTKVFAAIAGVAVLVAGIGGLLYARNSAPIVAPISPDDPAVQSRPYVVKLHAKWCPVCMTTKGVWAKLEETYRGRVNFVVLDFTNEAAWTASQAEADRLGLKKIFDDFAGATGVICILDAGSKTLRKDIKGSRDLADYSAAIDAALSASRR
jgi:thiol-disulfide isomerase/thioredoxin